MGAPFIPYVIAGYIIAAYNIASYNVMRLRPGITSRPHRQSGVNLPLEDTLGKRVPLWDREMGRSFPGRPLWETVSHFGAEFWDALSQTSLKGKARPGLRLDSGTWFPRAGSLGKCIPLWPPAQRSYHTSLSMCSAVSIQQENCRFSEKYTSLNLPGFHNFRPFRGADCRLPIQFQKTTSKQAIYLPG